MLKSKILIFSIFVSYFSSFSQVKVGENPSNINSSAVLEIESTNKGFLPPRMTTAQRDAIISTVDGLIIFNTTTGCPNYRYNGNWYEWCGICTPPTPNSPTSGSHSTSSNQIIWNWNSVIGSVGYKWNITNNYSSAINLGNTTTLSETGLNCGTARTIYIWAYNSCGSSAPLTLNATTSPCETIYSHTGNEQIFTVPAGVTSIQVKLWGAGGGCGWNSPGGYGGGGGYTQGTISVTPGQVLKVIVGGGGIYSSTSSTYGGGGGAGFINSSPQPAGSGGGRSAIRNSSNIELITAGGGGGSGSACGGTATPGNGGSGGGINGNSGVNGTGACVSVSGGGGAQASGGSSGGTGGTYGTNGSAFQGGVGGSLNGSNCRGSGGGGGGGYFGGGGGRAGECNGISTGGGGGGSSYISGAGVSNSSTTAGSGSTSGNSGDIDRNGAGQGGVNQGSGSHGRIIIRW